MESFTADHAVDKDLSTYSIAIEDVVGVLGWIKLEFDRTYTIHTVTVYQVFFTNWYLPTQWCFLNFERYKRCQIEYSGVDIAVYQGDEEQKLCGTLQITWELEQADQVYTFLCAAEGDTVLLSKDTGTQILFAEIVVTSSGRLQTFTFYIVLSCTIIDIN